MRVQLTVILLAIFFAFPVQAMEKPDVESVRCPDTDKGEVLDSFDIFEGPPDAGEYLMAADDGWDIEGNRSNGEKFYLVCRYGNAGTQLQIEFPPNIDFCTPAGDNVDCH